MMGDRENETLDVKIGWKDNFDELRDKYIRLLRNRNSAVSDVAEVMYGMIPSAYLDDEMRSAWEKYFMVEPDLSKEENRTKARELLRAFMDWADRNNMWVRKEFGDPLTIVWQQVGTLIDEERIEDLKVMLGVEDD